MQWFRNLRAMTEISTLAASMVPFLPAVSAIGYKASSRIARGMEEMCGNYAVSAIMMTEAKSLAIQGRRMLPAFFKMEEAALGRAWRNPGECPSGGKIGQARSLLRKNGAPGFLALPALARRAAGRAGEPHPVLEGP